MRFWDASAVVPLVVAEEETDHCRRLLTEDAEENPQDMPFVTLDHRLALAAEKEGFQILGVQG